MNENTNQDRLDEAIEAIRSDRPTQADVDGARARLEARMNADALPFDSEGDCIAAIPDYLAGRLSGPDAEALEAASRQSLAVRRALKTARQAERLHEETAETRSPYLRRFAAVAATVFVAVTAFLVLPEAPSLDQSEVVRVDEITGDLFLVVDGGLSPLERGAWIGGNTRVRTGKDSLAILFLDDGSRVEVKDRTELSVTRRFSGNRVDVERGNIIVEASPQGSGTLDVATNEFVVSVTGTIFEVGHGAMGSRVGVIEGEVEVQQRGDSTSVTPGNQLGSRTGMGEYHAASAVAWSRDADKYIAMLEQAQVLQQEMAAVMATEPRYSTRLLDLVPVDTTVYLAVPNAPEKITEAYELLKRNLKKEGMAEVWEDVDAASRTEHVDDLMTWLAEVGRELGDETVVSLSIEGAGEETDVSPLVLSEVDSAAFAASFDERVADLAETWSEAGEHDHPEIVLVDDPVDAVSGDLSVWLTGDLLVATVNPETLQEMAGAIEAGGSDFKGTRFHDRLAEAYIDGAEFLAGIHLADLIARAEEDAAGLEETGLADVEFLVAEREQNGRDATIDANLLFAGERRGVMSWLSEPGPTGALEFFSVYTTMVTSFVLKDPAVILAELEQMASTLAAVEADVDVLHEGGEAEGPRFELDIDWKNDVIGSLGGEVAFGLDGPAFPIPGWKVVVEVYNELQLQASIEDAIAQVNTRAAESGHSLAVAIAPSDVGPYTGYEVTAVVTKEGFAPQEFRLQYSYVDGYLVAAPSMALVEKSITLYQAQASLLTSQSFIERLPSDAGLDFSAMTFSRVGELVRDVLGHVPAGLSEDQVRKLRKLSHQTRPTLLTVYAEPEGMRFLHQGDTTFPLSMSQMLGMGLLTGLADGDGLAEVFGEDFDERIESEVIVEFDVRQD